MQSNYMSWNYLVPGKRYNVVIHAINEKGERSDPVEKSVTTSKSVFKALENEIRKENNYI